MANRLPAESAGVHQHRDDPQFRFQRPLAGRAPERRARRAASRSPAPCRSTASASSPHDGDVRDLRAAVRLGASSASAAGTRALRISIAAAAGVCNLLRPAVAGDRQRDRDRGELEHAAARHPLGRADALEERRDRLCGAQRRVRGVASPPKAWRARATRSRDATGCSTTSPGRSRSADFPTEGGPSLTPRVQLKYWPVETNAQPVVWAALELRKSVAASRHQAIEVFANKFTRFEIGSEPEKWDPQTRETADHSLPYIFARALVDGPITTRSSFTDDKVRDPALRPLMAKIKVTVDDALEAMLPRMVAAGDGDRGRRHASIRSRSSIRSAIRTIRCRTRTSRRSSTRMAEPVLGAGALPARARCAVARARRRRCRRAVRAARSEASLSRRRLRQSSG